MYADRIQGLKDLLAANPSQQVPEMRYLSEDRWLDLVQFEHHAIDPDNSHLLSSARSSAQIDFGMRTLWPALQLFLKQNQGRFPTELSQLAPYLATPVDASVLQDWTILPMASLPAGMRIDGDWVITQKAPVNASLDVRLVFGPGGAHIENNSAIAWGLSSNQP
jgi:hypothetical protein